MAIIVVEGLDGAGKSTQVGLLTNYLSVKGITCEYLHFPTMNSPVYGDLVARFLRGELGNIKQVNPYLVALIYAGDRYNTKSLMQQWLDQGTVIVLDRYVYSNIAYQCAKLIDLQERNKLQKWIEDTEFCYFQLPKPDLNIFLDVPFAFTAKKLKEERAGEDREYLSGKRDIHEEDLEFQKRVREVYLSLESDWFVNIDCCKDEHTILSQEEIFGKISRLVLDYIVF